MGTHPPPLSARSFPAEEKTGVFRDEQQDRGVKNHLKKLREQRGRRRAPGAAIINMRELKRSSLPHNGCYKLHPAPTSTVARLVWKDNAETVCPLMDDGVFRDAHRRRRSLGVLGGGCSFCE